MAAETNPCFRVVVYLGNGLDTVLGPFPTHQEASEACRPYVLDGYTADDFLIQPVGSEYVVTGQG